MADETVTKATAEDNRLTLDEHKEDSVLRYGVPPYALDGAVATERRKSWTRDEMQKLVDKFVKAEEQTER